MTGNTPSPRYRAYLLRCWQERGRQESQPPLWRFSLEDPHTGIRHGFATLEAVIAVLQQELAADAAPPQTHTSEHGATHN